LDYVLDIGLYRPVKGSVIFAAAKGFKDNGANLHSGIEFDEARLIRLAHQAYANKAMTNIKNSSQVILKSGFDAKASTRNSIL
jgi:hypothetical protein